MYKDRAHQHQLRVEFEDVDRAGVVHHPKYLHYYERSRHASCREAGCPLHEVLKTGIAFALVQAKVEYKKPLVYEQEFFVLTRTVEVKKSSLCVHQAIFENKKEQSFLETVAPAGWNDESGLVNIAELFFVAIDAQSLRPTRLPPSMIQAFGLD